MKVGWDDDIANIWKVLESHKKIFQTTNQIGFGDVHLAIWLAVVAVPQKFNRGHVYVT